MGKGGPVLKLSLDLLKTYKAINERYYATKNLVSHSVPKGKGPFNDGYDDRNNDYIIRIGEVFSDRYEILSNLGRGSFGQVVKAYDRSTKQHCAIKIIKNKPPFYNQGRIEIEILRKMNKFDPNDQYKIVRLFNTFKHRNHLCLTFEYLSYNLYELLKTVRFQGVSLSLVRKFAIQILTSLYFLSTAEISVIHCDLKPENILLCNPKRSAIKIIDFGSACLVNEKMYKYIQSRYYRSPETIMELDYSFPIDMWSLGCILVELHTGDALFNGDDECEQLVKISEVLGMPPDDMIARSIKGRKFFTKNPNFIPEDPLKSPSSSSPSSSSPSSLEKKTSIPTNNGNDNNNNNSSLEGSSLGNVQKRNSAFMFRKNLSAVERSSGPGSRSLHDILGIDRGGPHGKINNDNCKDSDSKTNVPKKNEGNITSYLKFKHLVEWMLEYDPKRRITPLQALHHNFFQESRSSEHPVRKSSRRSQSLISSKNSLDFSSSDESNNMEIGDPMILCPNPNSLIQSNP